MARCVDFHRQGMVTQVDRSAIPNLLAPPRAPLPAPPPAPPPAPAPAFASAPPVGGPFFALADLQIICPLHVINHGLWNEPDVRCPDPNCQYEEHICKDFWNGIKDPTNPDCRLGSDGIRHNDDDGRSQSSNHSPVDYRKNLTDKMQAIWARKAKTRMPPATSRVRERR